MATFPTGIKSFTNPISTDHMNTLPHATQHAEANAEITAIETALGVNLSNIVQEFKAIAFDRDLTAATASVAYTGVGFTPRAIIAFAVTSNTAAWSKGFSAGASNSMCVYTNDAAYNLLNYATNLINIYATTSALQGATVSSFDADGFTLAWTKTGSPTGTAKLIFLCIG